jgi:L-fuconolactonase
MTQLLDAHVHFWDPSARHHDWLAAHPRLQRRYGPEDLDAGRHEITGALFVQADCRDEEALDEVRWVTELAGDHPFVRGIVAYAPLHKGSSAGRHLRALAAEPLVVGVRRLLQARPGDEITDPGLIAGIRLLPDWDLTFDLCVTHDQLPAVAELVRACPETTFVLDHLGKPPVAGAQLDPWRDDLSRIASFPHVACKLSGLATEAAPGWTTGDVRPYIEHALEIFGPRRCMIGSDWPVATLQTTVERWIDVVLEVIADLPPEDQAAVLGDAAVATYCPTGPAQSAADRGDARSAVRR